MSYREEIQDKATKGHSFAALSLDEQATLALLFIQHQDDPEGYLMDALADYSSQLLSVFTVQPALSASHVIQQALIVTYQYSIQRDIDTASLQFQTTAA